MTKNDKTSVPKDVPKLDNGKQIRDLIKLVTDDHRWAWSPPHWMERWMSGHERGRGQW